MGKEVENTGQTVPCPDCKEILIAVANFPTGEGNWKMKCPNQKCKRKWQVKVYQKQHIELTKILVAIAIITSVASFLLAPARGREAITAVLKGFGIEFEP